MGAVVAANKIRGIRAGLCHDVYSAHQGVEHDDLNVLCLGARIIGPELIPELVRAFLGASFSHGERHERRLAKVLAMEKAAHDAIVKAIEHVIAHGPRTPDLGGQAHTEDVGQAIADHLKGL